MKPRTFAAIAIVVLTAILPGVVCAHAFLDHADPRVGSTVKNAPQTLRIWFTQAIEPVFSKVQVFNAAGEPVAGKDAHPDSGNHKLLLIPVPKLTPGVYRVRWSVVSVDTHRTQGEFKFTVKPG